MATAVQPRPTTIGPNVSAAPPLAAAWRVDLVPLLLLTGLALALRLLGLSHESIWLDEGYSLAMARKSFADLVTGRVYDPGNPQGYYLLLHLWQQLWGSASIETARALSALAGALCVPAVWLLARRSGLSRRTGLLAVLLAAVNPSLIYLSQEARPFALFATVATLAAAFVAAIVRGGKTGAWCGFTLCGCVLVHLHYYAAFVLIVLGMYLLVWGWRHSRGTIVRLALSALVVALAFAPWLRIFREQLAAGTARSTETWWQQLALVPLFTAVGRTLVWKEEGIPLVAAVDLLVVLLLFVPLAGLLVRGWRTGYVSDCRLRLSTFAAKPQAAVADVAGSPDVEAMCLGPAVALGLGLPLLVGLVSLKVPMIHTHYLLGIIPPLLLLAALAIEVGVRRRAWLTLAGPMLVLGLVAPASLVRLYAVPHKTDWRTLAQHVAEIAPNLPAYFYEDFGEIAFTYYRPEQTVRKFIKPFGERGEEWRTAGYFDQLHVERDGFWFVFYGTTSGVLAEEPRILAMLRREFDVVHDEPFGPMRLVLCRPAETALAQRP